MWTIVAYAYLYILPNDTSIFYNSYSCISRQNVATFGVVFGVLTDGKNRMGLNSIGAEAMRFQHSNETFTIHSLFLGRFSGATKYSSDASTTRHPHELFPPRNFHSRHLLFHLPEISRDHSPSIVNQARRPIYHRVGTPLSTMACFLIEDSLDTTDRHQLMSLWQSLDHPNSVSDLF